MPMDGLSCLSGSFAAERALSKYLDEIVTLTGEDVLRAIGRLPEAEQHCASLAALTYLI